MKTQHVTSASERAFLVGVTWKRARRIPGMPAGEQGRESLAELVELARSAGAEVAGTMYQVRESADPATLVGRGKLDEIRAEATAHKAPLIIFDGNLSPVQQRNIEEATDRRVIDRTQLILDIFARHALSRAEVLVSSRMFATLDPTIRAVRLPSHRRVLVSDTVGFIRDLPKGLLTAFRATLEEVQEAALILHVSDVSNPQHDELDEEVDKILQELGVADRPKLRVLNKVDLLSPEQRENLDSTLARTRENGPVLVSGMTGEGMDELLRRMDVALPVDPVVSLSLRLPLAEARTLALIHALGRVLHSAVEDSHMTMDAEGPASIAKRLRLSQYAAIGTSRVSLAELDYEDQHCRGRLLSKALGKLEVQ